MQIVPFKALFSRKSAPHAEVATDYARLIVDHLPYIEKQCRRAAESPGSYRSDSDVENEADHLLTEVIDHLKADDFKVLRDFRGDAKITTYLTSIISNLVVDIIRTRKGRSRAGERAKELGPVAEQLHKLVYGLGYATSKTLFAQAFTLDAPLALKDAGLAMRKFGGDGTVYIDIVRDEGGKPSLDGVRSMPVSLEKITRKPGYYWVDFTLPEKSTLAPGKYWLVLRHSGEAIMNWFYTPGKRVGGPDDSRSTALGWQWEDVLAGEFVYRVRGLVGN